MKIIILLISLISFVPIHTQAFTLNPLKWCKSEIKIEEKVVEKIVEKPVEKIIDNPNQQSKIDSLVMENKELKIQIKNLKNRLSSYEESTKKNNDILKNETLKVEDNLSKIKSINIKLAELEQLNYRIVNYKDNDLITALNNTFTVEGERLFNATKMNLTIAGPNDSLSVLPDRDRLYKITEDYRQKLKVDLARLQN